METAAIVAENPDWFTSTYGEIEFDSSVNSVTWANNSTLGESAAGQTIGYAVLWKLRVELILFSMCQSCKK